MFTNHGQATQHFIDSLYPFLSLEDRCTNRLGNFVEEKILKQLRFFLAEQHFLHLYALAQ